MNDPHTEEKYSRLRYMQRLATTLFFAMLVLLALSATLKTAYPWLQWVQAFTAAATVGAVADWFAVVALFRHPFGLPFPHTAIIPANKERLGASLGHFVEHNFLTPENVIRELERRNLPMVVVGWLADQGNVQKLTKRVCLLISAALNTLGDQDIRRLLHSVIGPQLHKLNLASIAGDILTVLTVGGRHQALLDRTLHEIEVWLVANEDVIKTKFGTASKFTPGILDNYIVNKFIAGIVALLHEVASDTNHPMRRQFEEFTREFIHKLKTSAVYFEQSEAFKRDLLQHLEREDYYGIVWSDIRNRIQADLSEEHSVLRIHVADALSRLASVLQVDHSLQSRLNVWLLQAIKVLLVRHGNQVSNLITDVVRKWDSREVGEKIELEIGKDLQYIRISGTLVGGAVGLLLHAIIGML